MHAGARLLGDGALTIVVCTRAYDMRGNQVEDARVSHQYRSCVMLWWSRRVDVLTHIA